MGSEGEVTLNNLINRLREINAKPNNHDKQVELMIEFEGKGQWQAPLVDVAVSKSTVILIYEPQGHKDNVREFRLEHKPAPGEESNGNV